ncbi:MAG: T9SS type A sorting domain-containing protein [Oligoflexus sp.]|nr:T9SS type A sorting domain-containing protein [Pseudopedobacter sp.]
MKNLFFLLFFLFVSNCFCQSKLLFDYDNTGNQIKRHLIHIGNKQNAHPPKNIKTITDSNLTKVDIYDDIKYYPNPVKEELYLKWELANDNKVLSIDLYSLSGQLIKKVNDLDKSNTYTFPFQDLPQAIYTLVLNYSNGEQKSLKIVKD